MFGYITKLGRGYTYKDNGYIDNNKNLISGKIGLQITIDYSNTCHTSILKSFKNLNLIDNLVWSINYTNSEEGYLILGEKPYQYNAKQRIPRYWNSEWLQQYGCRHPEQ